jgi:hypothetical protein
VNVQGFDRDLLEYLVRVGDPVIVCLTETHITEDFLDYSLTQPIVAVALAALSAAHIMDSSPLDISAFAQSHSAQAIDFNALRAAFTGHCPDIDRKNMARKIKKVDKEAAVVIGETAAATFDFQKVLNAPMKKSVSCTTRGN